MARGYLSVCLVGFLSMWHLVFILIFCLVRVYASASQVTLQQLYLLYPRRFKIPNYIISSVMHTFCLVLTYDLLEDRRIDGVVIKTFFPYILILYYIKQIDSKLLRICSAVPCVPLFCSYHILMSSVIYHWTDAWQLGIYLLNILFSGKRQCESGLPKNTTQSTN